VTAFIDTSAIYALLDADDADHEAAARWFDGPGQDHELFTHNYVVVESAALVHRRLGAAASRALFDRLFPAIEVQFVDERLHEAALKGWLSFGRRRSSLVDWVSFELIRRRVIEQAFAFDEDFAAQGIAVVP
jgi:predicted nucleic acid-binding protein